MNKRIIGASLIGATVLLATVLIFMLNYSVFFPSQIIGFSFIVYSEIVLFAGYVLIEYISSKSHKLMSWAGLGTAIGGYAFLVFLSSLIFMKLHILLYLGFVSFQIVLFVICVIVCVLIVLASISKKQRDMGVDGAQNVIQGFIEQLSDLEAQCEDKKTICKISEMLKYTDTSCLVEADNEIEASLSKLKDILGEEEPDAEKFQEEAYKLEKIIHKRNVQTRASKRGGY